MTERNDNILEHYGVKGQRWGVRRSRAQRKADKAEAKATRSADSEESDRATGSGSKSSGGREDIKGAKDKTRYKTKGKDLTDSELRARITRMETERRYADLNKRTVSTGEKLVTQVLVSVGQKTAKNVLTAEATKRSAKLFEGLSEKSAAKVKGPGAPTPGSRLSTKPGPPTPGSRLSTAPGPPDPKTRRSR